ncbi:MAG: F0F1 ATP synthase subunit A [Candidatus Sumerlaeota bacterium]
MKLEQISPDSVLYWQDGLFKLNATILFTWVLMAAMVILSIIATRRMRIRGPIPRWQAVLEMLVETIRKQIHEISGQPPERYLPFIGTLFLFVALSNLLAVVPFWQPPTASLSTTAALAICVFCAVPIYGVIFRGFVPYLKHYIEPSPLMLPFNILSELSRTLALAVRLFGNIMSGVKIVGILLAIVPLIFPVVMNLLGLLTGMIQAYIFAVLSIVYIASGMEAQEEDEQEEAEATS